MCQGGHGIAAALDLADADLQSRGQHQQSCATSQQGLDVQGLEDPPLWTLLAPWVGTWSSPEEQHHRLTGTPWAWGTEPYRRVLLHTSVHMSTGQHQARLRTSKLTGPSRRVHPKPAWPRLGLWLRCGRVQLPSAQGAPIPNIARATQVTLSGWAGKVGSP